MEGDSNTDVMSIMPLGAGNEVGRSCIILKFKGKTIMLDCGVHPAYSGLAALPFFDEIDTESVDICLITHFHLDHAAALPYFMEKTSFRGKVFMTHPTKAIYKWLLADYVRVSGVADAGETLYTESDLTRSFERITAIDYHQEIEVDGVTITALNAGHVLGAAMFIIEIAGVRILYTGDYSREEDRHLMAAEVPASRPDVMICESTYGVHSLQPRAEREKRFSSTVSAIVQRGGRCLIPVFALGRAQELLLILDEHWQGHPELHGIPVFYASPLAKRCMAVYQTYVNMMNTRIRRQITTYNPFLFRHVSYLRGMDAFNDTGPCVMMASPGMLQNGMSRELFERWCSSTANGLVIPGYVVEGTLGKHVLTEPDEIVSLDGRTLPIKCSIDYISFSAHVDYTQNSEFIEALKPTHLILVHGEQTEMLRLKSALQHRPVASSIPTYAPKNCETVNLFFRAERAVKLVGNLASEIPKTGSALRGVLVGKDFEWRVMSETDVYQFASPLKKTSIRQRQIVSSSAPPTLIEMQLQGLFGRQAVQRNDSIITIRDEFVVTVLDKERVVVEWSGDVINDMFADSIVALILASEYSRVCVKVSSHKCDHEIIGKENEQESLDASKENEQKPLDLVRRYLINQFGNLIENDSLWQLKIDGNIVVIHLEDLSVECSHESSRQLVEKTLEKIVGLLEFDHINLL